MSAKRSIAALEGRPEALDVQNNAERDLRRLWGKYGFTLPIPVQDMVHECAEDGQTIPTCYLQPQDWVKHWMDTYPKLLCGEGDPSSNLRIFWKVFQQNHPTHEVFRFHSGHLDQVVPLLCHGDEGRAVKKTNYYVLSVESPLGSTQDAGLYCSCCDDLSFRANIPPYGNDSGTLTAEELAIAEKQITIFKGHSYLSKYLIFGIGGWLYKKRPSLIRRLLEKFSENMNTLFHQGVQLKSGKQVYAALIGLKGDQDFQERAMHLRRSFRHLGTVNHIGFCPLCLAGSSADLPFEDFTEQPAWLATLHGDRPWDALDEPALSTVPYDIGSPEQLIAPDLFHSLKTGIGRDIVGGIVIVLVRLGFMDYEGSTRNIDDRLTRAHGRFKLWCLSNKKSAGLRSFSTSYFNIKDRTSAPWTNSKGSDTTLLLQWCLFELTLQLRTPTVIGYDEILRVGVQLCQAALGLRLLNHHGLWLPRSCARLFYVHCMTLLRSYSWLGKEVLRLSIRAFMLKPKCHAIHHLAWTVRRALERGATLIASPQMTACDTNEDFIGRISWLSRRVGFRHCDKHVCERYFLKVAALVKRKWRQKVKQPTKRRRTSL